MKLRVSKKSLLTTIAKAGLFFHAALLLDADKTTFFVRADDNTTTPTFFAQDVQAEVNARVEAFQNTIFPFFGPGSAILPLLTFDNLVLDSEGVNNTDFSDITTGGGGFTGGYGTGLMPYTSCRDQKFGGETNYTELICHLHDTLKEACEEEDECDDTLFETIPMYAMKGSVYDNATLGAVTYCAYNEPPYSIDACTEEKISNITVLSPTTGEQETLLELINGYQLLIGSTIGTDNALVSNGVLYPILSFINTRNMGIGDGLLDIVHDAVGHDMLRTHVVHRFAEKLAYFILGYGSNIVDALAGYFLQKYGRDFINDFSSTFPDYMEYYFAEIDNPDCLAIYFGSYHAWKGYGLNSFLEKAQKAFNKLDTFEARCNDEKYTAKGEKGKEALASTSTYYTKAPKAPKSDKARKLLRRGLSSASRN